MPTRPVFVFDGDGGFCTACVPFAERRLRPDRGIVARQFADPARPGVTPERAASEVLQVPPPGRAHGGARAVPKIPPRARPGRWGAHAVHRQVAGNRHRMPGGTAACAAPSRRGRE
ncbi:DUF393 domain-containing protein [Streptomyces sp.]|uniref:thiol-disulfide oxidoreductase DCC family protein n=1 Tax=Streptomyces sp. TaxID=1931 RepID=UPI0028125C5E|nr:DUF393 domain-containing protein [Streptomyces sp.]